MTKESVANSYANPPPPAVRAGACLLGLTAERGFEREGAKTADRSCRGKLG